MPCLKFTQPNFKNKKGITLQQVQLDLFLQIITHGTYVNLFKQQSALCKTICLCIRHKIAGGW